MEKIELVLQALRERMGQMVVDYETQIAILRAEVTQLTDSLNELTSSNVQKESN